METINVYSPVEDKKIKKELSNSPIWKKAYGEDELQDAKNEHNELYRYVIKFDGLTPVMVNKVSKVK